MLLDTKTRSVYVTIVTALSVANTIKLTAEYEDTIREKVTPTTRLVNGVVGDNTIVAQPADNTAREIQELMIFNGDTATHDVTVGILDDATKYPMKIAVALAANKTLYYNRLTGWVVV